VPPERRAQNELERRVEKIETAIFNDDGILPRLAVIEAGQQKAEKDATERHKELMALVKDPHSGDSKPSAKKSGGWHLPAGWGGELGRFVLTVAVGTGLLAPVAYLGGQAVTAAPGTEEKAP
jgi:hypothetical protein